MRSLIARERKGGFEILDRPIGAEPSLKHCRGRPLGLYDGLEAASQIGIRKSKRKSPFKCRMNMLYVTATDHRKAGEAYGRE